jgi:phospholipase C
MATDPALARLSQIRHIVVLMMENRSFDQMMGYLKRDGLPDVNGLEGDEVNVDANGKPVQVFEWGADETVFQPPPDHTGKILDPCHSEDCVQQQLADGNGGFVRNFVATRRDSAGKPVSIAPQYRRLPMGYYSSKHLPTYDFLARHFCVCDAWHSSVPGDTWHNRLFALAGRGGPRALPGLLERVRALFNRRLRLLEDAPIFEVEAFTRQLADEQWRWYSHDAASLRAADARYRNFGDLDRGNFAFFDRQKVSLLTRVLEAAIVAPDNLDVLDPSSNDDHPPSDVRAGQAFVLEVYEALRNSAEWEDTLLVVLYDEHGGFYDHVAPPALGFDDGSGYSTYGVRVPALIVGPRVARRVCHRLFDHTTLIKTILQRFAAAPEQAIARMGPRVAQAPHLGVVLLDDPRSDIPEPEKAREALDAWSAEARASRRGSRDVGYASAPDGAGRPFALHEFQEDFVKFALAMRAMGLPPGQP